MVEIHQVMNQLLSWIIGLVVLRSAVPDPQPEENFRIVKWCCRSWEELAQCESLTEHLRKDEQFKGDLHYDYKLVVNAYARAYRIKIECHRAKHAFECSRLVLYGQVDLVRLSAEEALGLTIDSSLSNLVTIASLDEEECAEHIREYSLGVLNLLSEIDNLREVNDVRTCFGEVGSTAGWVLPLYSLYKERLAPNPFGNTGGGGGAGSGTPEKPMTHPPLLDDHCSSDLAVVSRLLDDVCAPGKWTSEPHLADDYRKLCSACVNNECRHNHSSVANHTYSSLDCLFRSFEPAKVAFMSSREYQKAVQRDPSISQKTQFVCASGSAMSYHDCNLGAIPADVFVANVEHEPDVLAALVAKLHGAAEDQPQLYGPDVKKLLDTQDATSWARIRRFHLNPITQGLNSTILRYLAGTAAGPQFTQAMINSWQSCGLDTPMRLCIQSTEEWIRCNDIRMSWRSAGLPESLECVIGYSTENCVKMLNKHEVDLIVIEEHAAKQYVKQKRARPLLIEEKRKTWALALALRSAKPDLKLRDFASGLLNVCSAGTDSFAGWEAPNRILKKLKIIDQNDCKLTETWAKSVRSSCVPGARNETVTLGRNSSDPVPASYANVLCDACAQPTECATAAEVTITEAGRPEYDLYYSGVGALRCLLRRKSDIAFLASNSLLTAQYMQHYDADFRTVYAHHLSLLCGDGATQKGLTADDAESCNLGLIPPRWMVTRYNTNNIQLRHWQDIWLAGLHRSKVDWLHTHLNQGQQITDLIFSNSSYNLRRFDHDEIMWADDDDWVDPFICKSTAAHFAFNGANLPILSIVFTIVIANVL